MTYMANLYITKNEEKELIETFRALDLDGNGVLTVDELIEGTPLSKQATGRSTQICPSPRSVVL